MNLYTVIYKKQMLEGEKWIDDTRSNHSLIILAKDDEEAKEYTMTAIAKLNKHAEVGTRYALTSEPIKIVAASVCHDIMKGTSVTPIWGEEENYESKSIEG